MLSQIDSIGMILSGVSKDHLERLFAKPAIASRELSPTCSWVDTRQVKSLCQVDHRQSNWGRVCGYLVDIALGTEGLFKYSYREVLQQNASRRQTGPQGPSDSWSHTDGQ